MEEHRPENKKGLFLTLLFLCFAGSVLAQTPFAENSKGFSPTGGFATNGIDHVNLFSGGVTVSIPLGPAYPVGAGFSQQLHLVYNSKMWRSDPACMVGGEPVDGVYVTGLPAVGAGWALEMGHIPDSNAAGLDYVGPDGSAHSFKPTGVTNMYQTKDGSFIQGNITLSADNKVTRAVLNFSDGAIGTFSERIELSQINHGPTYRDFGGFDAPGAYLTRLENRFGDYVQVTYAIVADGSKQIQRIEHYGHDTMGRAGVLLRTINFSYAVPAGSTWAVLTDLDLPAVQDALGNSRRQHVLFSYNLNGIARPAHDQTNNQFVPCPNVVDRSAGTIFVPLLSMLQLDRDDPSLKYQFRYVQDGSRQRETAAGLMSQLTLPSLGAIQYNWGQFLHTGPFPPGEDLVTPPPFVLGSCPDNPQCDRYQYGRLTATLADRTEYLSVDAGGNPVGPGNTTYYAISGDFWYQVSEMLAPDGNIQRSLFHVMLPANALKVGNGLEYQTQYLDVNGHVVRTVDRCYNSDVSGTSGAPVCRSDAQGFEALDDNAREALTTASVIVNGQTMQSKRNQRSLWDGFGHFGLEESYGWDGILLRSIGTTWTPNTIDWILGLWHDRTETEGSSSVLSLALFDRATGFLKASMTWDATRQRVFGINRYADAAGNLDHEFSATADHRCPPNPCPPTDAIYFASTPGGVIGMNNDAFGKVYTYQNGQLRTSRWFKDTEISPPPAGPLPWYLVDQDRDPATGLVISSRDSASVATKYAYDLFGRVTAITPQATAGTATEAATSVSYDLPTQATVTRNGSDGNSTWQRYLYDGLGRLSREVGRQPGNSYSMRFHGYDGVGREYFTSEWVRCGDPAGCASAIPAQGTTSSAFDPFGHPQTITKADGQSIQISYRDGSAEFSDTLETQTFLVDGRSASTVARKDALGRITAVTEPDTGAGAETTFYAYDVLDKVAQVMQGSQTRSFVYDSFGFLRSEATPERGTVTYDQIGSLGNVIQSTAPGSLVLTRSYDAAGRLLTLDSNEGGSRRYLSNLYDEGGRGYSLGKLTTQTATNYAVAGNPVISDSLSYSGVGGRLSDRTTTTSGGSSLWGKQGWFYNTLGLVAQHNHVRYTGLPNFSVATSYDSGLPVTEYVNGIPMVTGISFQPAGAVASYTTGINTGHNVTTTVTQDPFFLPRPASIATSGASSNFATGAYAYDGAGNILSMSPDGAPADVFHYDARSRLISATLGTLGTQGFTYDRYGNLLTKGLTTFCDSTCENNRVPAATYDPRGTGNVIAYGSDTYEYDGLDRISRTPSSGWSYLYDGASERTVQVPSTGNWTYTFRDEAERVSAEFSGLTPSRDNVFLGSLLVVSYANSAVGGSGPVWTFYSSDHLGTPRLVTDVAGTTVETRKYWPYGEDAVFQSSFERLRFAGMERDPAGSRYYDHARSLDFGLGRFLSPDLLGGAIQNPQTWNRYAYARGNPLRLVDRNGLYEEDVHRYLTFVLALAVGMPAGMAERIGQADQGVDESRATRPEAKLSRENVHRLYHFTTSERRADLWDCFQNSGSEADLGIFLHAEQDSFSHQGFGPKVGHGLSFNPHEGLNPHGPDKTYNNPTKAYFMAVDTYKALRAAVPRLTGGGGGVALSVLQPYLRAFSEVRTSTAKMLVLSMLRRRIEREQAKDQGLLNKKAIEELRSTYAGK
jgi:RHS repeat-associated protein